MRPVFTKSCLLVVVILCASELVVRIFFARGMSGRFEYGYDPTSGFRDNADGSVDLVRAGGRRFRPQHFERHHSEHTFRIMVVGDSVPRGPSLEKAYPAKLHHMLRQEGVNAEALNLAVAGYGAHR